MATTATIVKLTTVTATNTAVALEGYTTPTQSTAGEAELFGAAIQAADGKGFFIILCLRQSQARRKCLAVYPHRLWRQARGRWGVWGAHPWGRCLRSRQYPFARICA